MKVVKFISNDPKQKAFEIALRENVNAYFKTRGISTKGNYKMYIKAIVFISIYIAPFIILLTVPLSGLMALLLVFIMGFGEAGIGMSVMHDAAHGAFSGKKWINTFFASSMYILGSNTFNWKIQHNILHHTFTNIYGYDQDIETKALIRLCEHAPLKKVHRFQFIYAFFLYGLMTLAKLVTDFGQLLEFNKNGITAEQNSSPKKEVVKLIITKILYGTIILGFPFLFSDFSWWQILFGFAILHFTAGIIMSTVFQMAHVVEGAVQPLPDENGVIHNEWVVHELMTTSNFAKNNFLLNWYVGGLNFQIEHHLFSNICHIHYRNISSIVEKTTHEFGLTYNTQTTFINALGSHIQRLKSLGN